MHVEHKANPDVRKINYQPLIKKKNNVIEKPFFQTLIVTVSNYCITNSNNKRLKVVTKSTNFL